MNDFMTTYSPRTAMRMFKELPEGTRAQLIGNNVLMEPAPTCEHQNVLLEILLPMANFIRSRELGEVLVAPLDVYLDQENAFQPDLLFVSRERRYIIKRNGLYGAPDLVVEILSPSTCNYDRNEKKRVYERSGVKEYWLVDPGTYAVQGFQLENGAFKRLPPAHGIIRSSLLAGDFDFSPEVRKTLAPGR